MEKHLLLSMAVQHGWKSVFPSWEELLERNNLGSESGNFRQKKIVHFTRTENDRRICINPASYGARTALHSPFEYENDIDLSNDRVSYQRSVLL